MQMLVAAGFPVAWNCLPNRNTWNERGFYEVDWKTWTLDQCEGKAVKLMPFDLDRLTPDHTYRFIVLLRNAACIEQSMANTVQWRGAEMSDAHKAAYWQQYVLDYVRLKSRVVVGFDELFTGAAQTRIAEFMGFDALQVAKMNDCVDHSMWHFKPEAK
jgi:hypothetical protein